MNSTEGLKSGVSVNDATHVKVNGRIEKISSKWGILSDGRLSKPSEGGFGVVTENGRSVGMMEAELYYKEEGNSK